MADPNFKRLYKGDGKKNKHPSEIEQKLADEAYKRTYGTNRDVKPTELTPNTVIQVNLQPGKEVKLTTSTPDNSQKMYWTKIAKIALPNLPVGLPDSAVRLTLRMLKSNGYHIKHYSNLSRQERLNYLLYDIKPDVYKNGEIFCPEVTAEIKKSELDRRKPSREERRKTSRKNLQSFLDF
jgi:hypothetical protein|tara:strand:- start:281 stop:820 length:540 start_codon:yes stop_codon:yes gene_type:complete